VLGRVFGLKCDEIGGGRRKLHNEELYNMYSSTNIIRMIIPPPNKEPPIPIK
jgi:hypothetical protein